MKLITVMACSAVLVLFTGSALAVGCNVTQSTPEFIEMNRGGTLFRVFHDELRQGSDSLREADLQTRLFNIMQFRQTRADLPVDDPDRFIDPGGPFAGTGTDGLGQGEELYWCDVNGNPTPGDPIAGTHMCAIGDCVIFNVATDPDGSFVLSIRNGQDCSQNPDFPSCL